jgi:hypothetical protein
MNGREPHAYSSKEEWLLHLLSRHNPLPPSGGGRHNIPPNFYEGNSWI